MASILTDENISIVNNLDSFRVAAVGALSDIRLIVVIPAMAFCVSGIAVGAVFVAVDQTGVMRSRGKLQNRAHELSVESKVRLISLESFVER